MLKSQKIMLNGCMTMLDNMLTRLVSSNYLWQRDKVCLSVLKHYVSLKARVVPKLLPRYCNPFVILKKIESVSYKLLLPEGNRLHPTFHESRVKKFLGADDNVVNAEDLASQSFNEDHRSGEYYALWPWASQQDSCGGGIVVGCHQRRVAGES